MYCGNLEIKYPVSGAKSVQFYPKQMDAISRLLNETSRKLNSIRNLTDSVVTVVAALA